MQQLESRLANQGLDMDIYLKTREMDEQGLRDEAEPVAETRVKRSLTLLEIARQEEIDVSEEELQEETTRTLDSITQFMSDADRKRYDSPEALLNITGNIYAEIRMNRTIEYLRSVANGEAEAAAAEDDAEGEETEAEKISEETESIDLDEEGAADDTADADQADNGESPAAEADEDNVLEEAEQEKEDADPEAPADAPDEDQ